MAKTTPTLPTAKINVEGAESEMSAPPQQPAMTTATATAAATTVKTATTRKMPKTRKRFGRRLHRNVQITTVLPVAPQDDVTPPHRRIPVRFSSEPSSPYKKMRVGECRLKLVDRDEEITQLKLALEASKNEKDASIAERREALAKMSKDLQASRRECNLMLADQRELNTQVAKDAKNKVAASRRNRDTVVAKAKDDTEAQVSLSVSDQDSKIAKAISDKKRVLQAERQYCKERRKEATSKSTPSCLTSGLFMEI